MSLVKTVNRKVSTTGFWYVVEARLRNMLKWTRIIIFVAIANPVLYLISIGIGVGSLIDGNSPVDGVNYLTFLAPALLASAAIQGMLDEVIFPTFQGFKWYKNFFAMNATPLTGRDIAGGVFFSALIRTVFTVILAGAGFGALILALAARAKSDDLFMMITGRFIMMPLFLFSGTFYPLEQMPVFLQWIGWISPLWHATDLGRLLTYGSDVSVEMVIVHLTYMLVMLVVGLFFAFRNYSKRLAK
jgi:lipooligosaccharide transport system permease protein